MANTTHSVDTDQRTQRTLDFLRKILEDSRYIKFTGCVTIRLTMKDGGIRACEQTTTNMICLE